MSLATCSPMASEAVRPGLSIPNKATSPSQPVRGRSVDAEVGLGRPGSMEFRPQPGVVRAQGARGQSRPEGADRSLEAGGGGGVDGEVRGVHEAQIRAEHRLAAEVAAIMEAQRARHWRRVDQAREGRRAAQAKVRSLAVAQRPNGVCGIAFSARRKRLCAEPGGDYRAARREGARFRAADTDAKPAPQRLNVPCPVPASVSSTSVERPRRANASPQASPTAPAPTTAASMSTYRPIWYGPPFSKARL